MTELRLWGQGSTTIPWPPQLARCRNAKEKCALGSYSSVDPRVTVILRCLCKSRRVAVGC